MHIVLEHLPAELYSRPDGWTVVGRVDNSLLTFDAARQPFLMGRGGRDAPEALDPAVVNTALARAVDAAANRLWPDGWHAAFSRVFGVHRRSLSAERLAKKGLPPSVLQALARYAGEVDAEGRGRLLLALAEYADGWGQSPNPRERIEHAQEAAQEAGELLKTARKDRPVWPERDTTP